MKKLLITQLSILLLFTSMVFANYGPELIQGGGNDNGSVNKSAWSHFGSTYGLHDRTYNSSLFIYASPRNVGSGMHQVLETEIGKEYEVSAILIGSDTNKRAQFNGESYITISSASPLASKVHVFAESEHILGGVETSIRFRFTAQSTMSYLALRSDAQWHYASARAISVKMSGCNEVVLDIIQPTLILLGQNPVNLIVGEIYTDAGATANDTRDGNVTANIVTTSTVDITTAGTYLVTYDVNDTAGNNAQQITRTVNVALPADTEAPVISLIGEETVTLVEGERYPDAGATAVDNIDGDISAYIVTVNPVDFRTAGTYMVTYDINDSAGNQAETVIRTVIVNKPANQVPTVSISMEGNTSEVVPQNVAVVFTAFGQDVDGVIVSYAWEDNGASIGEGEYFEYTFEDLGEHNISMTVTDDSGATATASMLLTVVDAQAPVITLVGANPQQLTVGDDYVELGATAQDTDGVSYTDGIIIDASGVDTSVEGNYTVTYNVEDDAGNAAPEVNRTVAVEALANPPLTRAELDQLINNWESYPSQSNADKVINANTSQITDMNYLFYGKDTFNLPIGAWDTSSVTEMNSMFVYAEVFNQPIGNWDTSSVTNMRYMFHYAQAFNQPIGTWDTSSVTNMTSMFSDTDAFNQPIGTWDTSSVIGMQRMFRGARAFNQNISNWNVSSVRQYHSFSINSPLESQNKPNFP